MSFVRRVEVKYELSDGDPELEAELKLRIEQVERGEVKLIPAAEVIAKMQQLVREDRKRYVQD